MLVDIVDGPHLPVANGSGGGIGGREVNSAVQIGINSG
jgi:hypothetical protein